jgi:hypothetical protein
MSGDEIFIQKPVRNKTKLRCILVIVNTALIDGILIIAEEMCLSLIIVACFDRNHVII